ncbi:MAG: hypothetical protein GX780_00495 [Campylobacteraceae bacterium]|nr:hypothetical protein [Campylobacteraceae bacterium]
MNFLPQRYFSNLFVAIIIEDGECRLLAKIIKNKKVQKTYEAAFDNPQQDILDPKVVEYIQDKAKMCLDIYVAYFLGSIGQGVLPTAEPEKFKKFFVDIKSVKQIKIANSWSAYASYLEINSTKKFFEEIGLDLLYSPFILLNHCVQKENLRTKPTLYMYNHKDSFAIAVYKESKVLFGAFFRTSDNSSDDDMEKKEFSGQDWNEVEEELGVESLILLDENDSLEDYQSLDDLDDLDNLDAMIDGSSDEEQDFDEGPQISYEEDMDAIDSEKSIELFGRNMLMYKYLKSSIEEFYSNKHYESDFIENIVIFDNYEMSQTVFDILESELFVSIELQKVKTLELMTELGLKDLGL